MAISLLLPHGSGRDVNDAVEMQRCERLSPVFPKESTAPGRRPIPVFLKNGADAAWLERHPVLRR